MDLDQDLARIALQEERLQFSTFDADMAWQLGMKMREAAVKAGHGIAIEIRHTGIPMFYSALPGTSPDNAEWLRRKRNVVERFHKSSYAIGLMMEKRGTTLGERYGLAAGDFVGTGGGFPIRVRGVGVVGFVGVSGLVQRDDHSFIVSQLAAFIGQDAEALVLD